MARLYLFLALSFLSISLTSGQEVTVGLIKNDSLSYNGYTLIAPSSNYTYLIDNCGFVVNTWYSDYPPGESMYLLENGNLLRTARIGSSFNSGGTGGRLELFNWDGELIWSYVYSSETYHQHHDIEPMANGNILLIAWEYHSVEESLQAGRDPSKLNSTGLWTERVIELEPMGDSGAAIVWRWSLWDHLVQDYDAFFDNFGTVADHPELINFNYAATASGGGSGGGRDWIHLNAIDYNPELDQILLSSRVMHEFWVIDHSTTIEEAASHSGGNSGKGGDILYRWGNPNAYDRGEFTDRRLYGQHDVHWIDSGLPDEGKIMIFNNGQGRPGGNLSSVDVISPPILSNGNYTISAGEPYGPQTLYWTFQDAENFYSSNLSGAQRLPNGNTLICEGRFGRVFEITNSGNIVWEYISPVSANGPVSQGDGISFNGLFRAPRYGAEHSAFADKILEPGDPIELNPLPSNCMIFDNPVDTQMPVKSEEIILFPNPMYDRLIIENKKGEILWIEIFDSVGRLLQRRQSNESLTILQTGDWNAGVYMIRLLNLDMEKVFVGKVT